MISIIISWIIIAACSLTIGTATIILVYGKKSILVESYETAIIVGLAACTFYAQICSFFGGVSLMAFVGVLVLAILALLVLVRNSYDMGAAFQKLKELSTIKKVSLVVAFISVLLWTNMVPQHYDTYLYHAQAVRWIEEYGVVPGLANFHFRLGYDSAFMSLQALFSFKWLAGQSLHTVNGFFAFTIIAYVIITTRSILDKVQLSDLFRVGFWLYIFYDSINASSPNTDTIALMLAYYILIKWMEYSEDDDSNIEVFSLLCVIVVYAITMKVSVGILALLVIYPAVELIKSKKIGTIICHLLLGIALLIPYLIRNVIISGYLLYPYKFTGINSLEWIVPEEILDEDCAEIIAWGRGNQDITRNAEHIWQWLPDWFISIHVLWKILMVLSLISLVIIVVMIVTGRFKLKFSPMCIGIGVCIGGLFFWLLTSPLPRYGTIYMVTLPCIALSMLVNTDKLRISAMKLHNRYANGTNLTLILLYLILFIGYVYVVDAKVGSFVMQGDYDNKNTYIDNSLGVDVAIATEGDQTGYDPFPSSPYVGSVQYVELRGDSLKDGFKRK